MGKGNSFEEETPTKARSAYEFMTGRGLRATEITEKKREGERVRG